MRKALFVSLGVAAAFAGAVFVGAAAATTGAPVFYDARYPQSVPAAPEGYEAGEAGGIRSQPGGTVDQADADGAPLPTPERPAPSTPPGAAPPSNEGATPAPTPSADPDGVAPDDPSADTPDAVGRAPGGPPRTPDADAAPPSAEEREAWRRFQQVVRTCMAEAGHEYRYWEWWSAASDPSNRFPAMPDDLTPEQFAAWELALYGATADGGETRGEDAGCWGYALRITGASS
jgi:hypothetical protein